VTLKEKNFQKADFGQDGGNIMKANHIIILLVCFTFFSNNVFTQNNDTLIFIKGYVFSQCPRNEIAFGYKQDLLEAIAKYENKKYNRKWLIDIRCSTAFISLQVGNKKIENDFAKEVVCVFSQTSDTAIILPGARDLLCADVDKLKLFFGKGKYNIERENLIINNGFKFSPYYYFDSEPDKLYKIFYLEGYAMYFKDKGWQNNPNKISVGATFGANYTDLLFITKITNYSTIIDLPNLKVWYPYLENE
jgi:hypothetical protein